MTEEINKIQLNNEIALFDERNKLLESLPTIEAVTDDNAQEIGKLVKSVDSYCKKVKNERLSLTRRIDALKKAFMDKEHELTDQLIAWKNNALQLTTIYTTEKERARIEAEKAKAIEEAEKAMEEERKAALASAFGQVAPPPQAETPPPVEILPPEKTKVANLRQIKTARFEITDENKIPRQFLSVDERKIKQYADDAMKQGIELETLQVDGIRFFTEIKASL